MNTTPIGKLISLTLLTVNFALWGCASSEPTASGPALPHRLAITMHTRTSDLRITYFVLHPHGQLEFSGGTQATTRQAQPAGQISADQQARLIQIIQAHQLLQAKGAFFLSRGQQVTCELSLTLDDQSNSIMALDDQIPGTKELHQALMDIQSQLRYHSIPGIK